jgi:ribulose-5-phosphate 4-epimerase/fuculose-1-phosphate aldolase
MTNTTQPQTTLAGLKLKSELVDANHVLAHQGVLDAFGHVSVRQPEHADHFLISRSMAPELVNVDDIIVMDLACNVTDGSQARPYLESFIHAEIYRARPDVQAVVHSHARSVIPFGAVNVPLRPVCHMAGFLSKGAPVFDIRHRFGCTDMLVRNASQGKALAATLGRASVALMRGHGFVSTGDSIAQAVFRAIYTEANAAIQASACMLSKQVAYLDVEEGLAADETNSQQIDRAWSLWKRHAAERLR